MQGEKGIKRAEQHLAMLGHELRNALNGMLSVTEMLGESGLSGEQRQLLKALRQSGKQLHWLIESVDPGGRSTEFPFTPVYGELNGVDLLEQAIRCHMPAATLKNNLLLLTVEPKLSAWWFSDARLLRQVIDNLLGNAIKYTQSAVVEMKVRRAVGKQGKAGGLELRVHDSGPGISMEDSKQIFEPWVQLDDDRIDEGVGLGLHVCRRIVSNLKGKVDYCCDSGAGSYFRVCLPGVVECGLQSETQLISGLYSRMICRVSVRDSLAQSLESLLARMGIRTGSSGQARVVEADIDLQILITESQIFPTESSCQNGLQFTPGPVGGGNGALTRPRRLQAPFLESTLGPLLMEMSLEWRMAKQASTPDPMCDRSQTRMQMISDKPD
jgi:anti-sigma regulatory factor (Ser/Thr protein kinase)